MTRLHAPLRALTHAMLLAPLCLLPACGDDELLPEPDPAVVYAIEATGPHKGPADALVTVVEVADFQCGFCRAAFGTVSKLVERHDDVRVVWTYFPLSFHDRAVPAAVAARCADEQERFWDFATRLVNDPQDLSDRVLRNTAAQSNLDTARWLSCVAGDAARRDVERDKQRMLSFGVRYTPTFFINGRYVAGALSEREFDAVIDRRRREAQQELDAGTARADLYQRMVLDRGQHP